MQISEIRNTQDFQDLCQKLLQAEYPDVQIVNDSSGDAGIDAYVPSSRTLFAMYCPEVVPVRKKYYQDKIRPDLAKAARLKASGLYQIDHWVFLTPASLPNDLHQYISKKATAAGFISGTSKAEPYLLDLLLKHERLRSQFPKLLIPDIEKKLESGFTEVNAQLDALRAQRVSGLSISFDLAQCRKDAAADAKRFVEMKSRALKGRGPLPEMLVRNVSIQVKGTQQRFNAEGQLLTYVRPDLTMSLLKASKHSRRTLLLGDLGTGKSTLAGEFVGQTMQENDRTLAFIIPAKGIKLEHLFTIRDLLKAASDYFSKQISPASQQVDLEALLKEKIEITLIIDGIDEVSLQHAAILLNQLRLLVLCNLSFPVFDVLSLNCCVMPIEFDSC